MKPAPDYQALYVQGYDLHNVDRTLAGRFLQRSHRLLEDTLPRGFEAQRVLEVGAGSGHHYAYVAGDGYRYVMTDNSDGMMERARARYTADIEAGRLTIEKQDAAKLTYPDASFDRLIATHVLEHMPDPVAVLGEWNRVVRPGGLLSIVLPCDPGLAWRLGRNFGPRRNSERSGLAYDYLQAAEHINPIFNLVVFIRHHFESVAEHWYPFPVPLADINLFYACHIRT